jgi:hypothetical protein
LPRYTKKAEREIQLHSEKSSIQSERENPLKWENLRWIFLRCVLCILSLCVYREIERENRKNESGVSKLHDFFWFPFGEIKEDQRDDCTFHGRIRAIQRDETI